jgi:hypothetical protein
MEPRLDTVQSRLDAHLTDEQFTDLLLGTNPPAVRAHLEVCQSCSQEADRVSAAIGSFQEQSQLWAERRAAVAQPLRAIYRPPIFPWLHRPLAWSAAALVVAVTAGIGISRHAEQLGPVQPIAAQRAAVSPTTLQSDNQLLSAIDGELHADEPTTGGLYGLNAASHGARAKATRRLSN